MWFILQNAAIVTSEVQAEALAGDEVGVGDERAGVATLADAVWQRNALHPNADEERVGGSGPGPPPDGLMPLADYFGSATVGPSCSR